MLHLSRWYENCCTFFIVFFLLFSLFEIKRGIDKERSKPFEESFQSLSLESEHLDDYENQLIALQGYLDQTLIILPYQQGNRPNWYRVYSVFQPRNFDHLVLIDRGYTDKIPVREKEVLDAQLVSVAGQLLPVSSGGLKYPKRLTFDEKEGVIWLKSIDLSQLETRWKLPFSHWMLQLSKQDKYAFSQGVTYSTLSSHRHYAYAVEFFLLAIVVWSGRRYIKTV